MTLRENARLFDLNFREVVTTLPFLALIVLMGLRPQPFLDRLNPSSDKFVARALYGGANSNVTDDQVKMNVMALPPQVASAESGSVKVQAAALPAALPRNLRADGALLQKVFPGTLKLAPKGGVTP